MIGTLKSIIDISNRHSTAASFAATRRNTPKWNSIGRWPGFRQPAFTPNIAAECQRGK
jgi:hypothetical protein